MAIFERSPKTRVFLKSVKGGPRKKKWDKKKPSLKRLKSTLAQIALSSNEYALIVQRIEKILAQKAGPKVLEWPSYGNFGNVTHSGTV